MGRPNRGWVLVGKVETDGFPECGEEVLLVLFEGREAGQASARVMEIARSLGRAGLTIVAYHAPGALPDESCECPGCPAVPLPDADRGGRLEQAFVRAFRHGARRVVAVDGNVAGVTAEILEEAFEALRRTDASVGPSLDGGYYLIGLSRPCHRVFRGIPWTTDRTLRVTLAHLRSCGLGVRILPPVRDCEGRESGRTSLLT